MIVVITLNELSDRKVLNSSNDESSLSTGMISQFFSMDASMFSGSSEIWHRRRWKSIGRSDEFDLKYTMDGNKCLEESAYKNSDELILGLNRFTTQPPDEVIWQEIYGGCYRHDTDAVSHIADSLQVIARSKGMSRLELANLLVTFAQDFPYYYILDEEECGENGVTGPCLSNARFGLLSPKEVAFAAFGDCDSKALFLFSMLKHLGFKPLIVISREYQHAMLAVNLPTTGSYISYKSERFYFWEVTTPNWPIGILPPDCSNINYWKIALSYEY